MQATYLNQAQMTEPAILASLNLDKASVLRLLENPKTLNDWLMSYLENIKDEITINTFNNYRSYITMHILPSLGDMKLIELTAPVIKQYIKDKLSNGRIRINGNNLGLSIKTVKEHIVLLKKALNKAVEEGEMLFNPCIGVSFPKDIKPEIKPLEQEEQELLESHIHPHFKPNSLLSVKVALYAGLRNGEVCALQIKDIDFKNHLIHVTKTLYRAKTENGHTEIRIGTTKNKRNRYVPITKELEKDLLIYLEAMPKEVRDNPEQFLFVNNKGKSLEPKSLLYHFKKLLKQCDLSNIRFHDLRHTFATRCLECGIELKIVSKMLGHSSIQITADLYTHVTNKTMCYAMIKLNKENWLNINQTI